MTHGMSGFVSYLLEVEQKPGKLQEMHCRDKIADLSRQQKSRSLPGNNLHLQLLPQSHLRQQHRQKLLLRLIQMNAVSAFEHLQMMRGRKQVLNGWNVRANSGCMHEDCIDYDVVVGSDGKELLCPYCVV